METLIAVCVVGFGGMMAVGVYQSRKIGALAEEVRAQRAEQKAEAAARLEAARPLLDARRVRKA